MLRPRWPPPGAQPASQPLVNPWSTPLDSMLERTRQPLGHWPGLLHLQPHEGRGVEQRLQGSVAEPPETGESRGGVRGVREGERRHPCRAAGWTGNGRASSAQHVGAAAASQVLPAVRTCPGWGCASRYAARTARAPAAAACAAGCAAARCQVPAGWPPRRPAPPASPPPTARRPAPRCCCCG